MNCTVLFSHKQNKKKCNMVLKLLIVSLVMLAMCTRLVSPQLYSDPEIIKLQIVGLFDADAQVQKNAFNESITNAKSGDKKLEPIILSPNNKDSYSSWKTLCSADVDTVKPVAVIGPQNGIYDTAVREQCNLMHIPHIQAAWQPHVQESELEIEEENTDDNTTTIFDNNLRINFYPNAEDLSLAFVHLLNYYNWENFAVLYEDDYGLMRVQKILAEYTSKFTLTVRKLDPNGNNNHIFKDLTSNQESRIILDCDVDNVWKYMEEAKSLEMLNDYQHYILTSLDTAVLIDKLEGVSSNVTWLSISNFEKLSDPKHSFAPRIGNWVSEAGQVKDSPPVTKMKLETLLMNDIASHVMNSLKHIDPENLKDSQRQHPCEDASQPWQLGEELLKNLLEIPTTGVSGNVVFDSTGQRINYTLYVNEIHVKTRHTVGRWESATLGPIIEERPVSVSNLQNSKHFVIISRLAKPYLQYTNASKVEYEGFSVDLVEAIFGILKEMGYNYTFSFAKHLEGKPYGKYNPTTKKWDGLIGDLLDKKADLAVCDITITEARKNVVDFSVPFMTLGISILYKKEQKKPPETFNFLFSYSVEVWLWTATAYCLVSIILYLCSRISPADWENPQPCDKDPEELENIWNFKNCAWLTMGSIMTQGCDILPKAIGSRWVCGMWWFFAMIVCQTYIAQRAASLTSAMEDEPINSVEDLAKQNKILYGMISAGSTYEFFKNSKDKMYQRMFENMEANPVVYTNSNDEGEQFVLNKAKNGYAFFMESSSIEYKLKRNCDLKKVGGELDSKDYGIAMPSNSPFRSQINMAILRLKELTKLDEIKKKWWEKSYGAKECEEENVKGDVDGDLEMVDLIGAFLVLIVGLVLCLIITAAEFINEVRNIVIREQVTHKEAFIKELTASLDFRKNQKPVLRNPSRAPSVVSSLKSAERVALRAAVVADFMAFEKNG